MSRGGKNSLGPEAETACSLSARVLRDALSTEGVSLRVCSNICEFKTYCVLFFLFNFLTRMLHSSERNSESVK